MAVSSPSSRVEVHVRTSPQFDAFEPWHASLASLFFDVSLNNPNARAAFRGDVTGVHLGESLIFRSASVGHCHRRDAAFIRRSPIDHIMIEYQTSGRRTGMFGKRSLDVSPGDISFLDFGRTVESEEPDFSRISLIVPRDRLPPALRERDLHGVVFRAAHEPARLLGRYLDALVQAAERLSQENAASALDAAFALAQHALDGQSMPRELRLAARPVLRDIARAQIERDLLRNDLSPARIAAAIGVSRATLYRLFEADGGIRSYVVSRRLDRCFDRLLNDRLTPIGDIAFGHGFNSEAHFSRAFRSRYGITPRDVRGLARMRRAGAAEANLGPEALNTTRDWVRDLAARSA